MHGLNYLVGALVWGVFYIITVVTLAAFGRWVSDKLRGIR